MRKVLVLALVGVLASAVATAALAQGTWPNVTVKPSVTPNKAGTTAHPQGVQLKVGFHWETLGASNQPIVTKFVVKFPKGSLYNGGSATKCSLAAVTRGPQACPSASIVGSGTGDAYADTVITHPKITVVNGGASTVYFYTVLNNPARVQEPVIGHITRTSGNYAYTLSVTVPNNLRIVAGVPIELTSLSVSAGKGSWLATTGCTGGHWPFAVTTSYENPNTGETGQASYSSSVACHK
jgi:hypothetical protein